jgi:hypothetical protein
MFIEASIMNKNIKILLDGQRHQPSYLATSIPGYAQKKLVAGLILQHRPYACSSLRRLRSPWIWNAILQQKIGR